MQRIRALDPRRLGLAFALVAALLAGLILGPLGSDSASAKDKIEAELVADLEKDPDTPFWIRFSAKADLSKASATKSRDARGKAVLKALRDSARVQQADVLAKVKASGADYRAFWASNTVYVTGGSLELATSLAEEGEVSHLEGERVYELPEPIKGNRIAAVDSAADDTPVEWGLKAMKADSVWNDFGTRGEGIVIGSIDTGAQYDHPALKGSYRGARADGTYDHNYNWFDPARDCGSPSLEPCDNNGHGTHTIGTMAGGKGTTTNIGVAPGAKWISAKGCRAIDCPQYALLASAEWMLAPTDLNGNNPRPELRPDIVNNSWGDANGISTDPWYQDSVNAWIAAGIFPVFSNGNSGPGCNTAGSPGDYASTYAVGAYDSQGRIAQFSSRGQGEDGEIKPDIAAPGVNVYSAAPGSKYATMSGTSMAAPHTAGAVALLWSAAPRLAHDIDATRALLDQNAVDVDDRSCGGTAANNNVWGEGELDAVATVDAAPRAGTGMLTGKITDESGKPVSGANLRITGPLERQQVSDGNGTFELRLLAGEYKINLTAYGYFDTERTVTVTADGTATADFTLKAAPKATVRGKVTDGSGHGWPLYAKVSVSGVSQAGPWFTDPKTGAYELTLPQTAAYTVNVEAVSPGYQAKTAQVPFTADGTQDISVAIAAERCVAPGYAVKGLYETFDSAQKPAGWSLVNHNEAGNWEFDDPGAVGNRTLKGQGHFASLDNRFFMDGSSRPLPVDSDLVSPAVDLTGVKEPVLKLESDFQNTSAENTVGIGVSTDNGETWTDVWSRAGSTARESLNLPLPQAAGQPQVKVRFNYKSVKFGQWWTVDDVLIGDATCAAADGGLVVGQVGDRNTGTSLQASAVSASAGESARSVTTEDPAVGDGLFVLFARAGEREVTAAHDKFTTEKKTVTVRENAVTGADFTLDAGRLKVEEDALAGTVDFGERTTKKLTLTNTGKAPLTVETGAGANAPAASTTSAKPVAEDKPNPERSVKIKANPGFLTSDNSPLPATGTNTGSGSGTVAAIAGESGDDAWRTATPYPSGIMDAAVAVDGGRTYSIGGFDGKATTNASYVYDRVAKTWSPIPGPAVARQGSVAAFLGGKLYVTGGWTARGALVPLTEVYDPKTSTWSTVAMAPYGYAASGRAVIDGKLYVVGGCAEPDNTLSGRCGYDGVYVYDPVEDRWTAAAKYPVEVSYAACGGIGGKLYCAGGHNVKLQDAVYSKAYVYDPAYDHWSPIADLPVATWASAYGTGNGKLLVSGGVRKDIVFGVATNEGFAYDPAKNTWSPLPNTKYPFYRAGSNCGMTIVGGNANVGGYGNSRVQTLSGYEDCDTGSVSWASADRTRITLAPGERKTLSVALDSEDMEQPGTYNGALHLRTDSPYAPRPVPLKLQVTPPPSWAKVTVTVKTESCKGTSQLLQGAYVEIDGTRSLARKTDADGQASVWLPAEASGRPVTVIASKGSLSSAVAHLTAEQGSTQSHTLTLKPAIECAG